MVLISGLPVDVAYDCLIRVDYKQFPTMVSVCKGWKAQVEQPEFLHLRKLGGHGQKLIVMIQAHVDPNQGVGVFKCLNFPVYRLTLFEPDVGHWSELPPVSGSVSGLPMFCQLATVGSELVVIGGLDPLTCRISNLVFVYNFVSATWRRGINMPGDSRIFFGCASDFNRMVFVVGGHDDEKNALKSAIAYDVVKDEWIVLPDMASQRDECKAIFERGKLHVIGGYCTEMQGRFETSAETFNISTWQWDQVQEDFLHIATCPQTCVNDDNEAMYMCQDGDVVEQKCGTWQIVAKLPAQIRKTACVTAWQCKLLVIGCAGFDEPYLTYMLDLENYTWTRLETPQKYSGHVQLSCYMDI